MDFKKHRAYYVSLFLILVFGFTISLTLNLDKRLQVIFIVLTSLSYVVWGIVHHLIHHNLTPKIMIEYVLIGALGMSIVVFLLRGGLLY